tara:strand:- start:302 stop:1114 length:813 start_codon:yes stop_codon:yes gene_type:complete
MPELPEVETTIRSLNILKNKKVTNLNIYTKKLRYPVPLNRLQKLKKSKLINIRRISKYIVLDFNNSYTLVIHLGMSGRLRLANKNTTLVKHDHIVCKFNKNFCLFFNDPRKFGFIDFVETSKINELTYIMKLGIDALDKKLSTNYLFDQIKKTNVLIKQVLLNQHIVCGIGNIYASEILFDAKISPFIKGKDLNKSQITTILKSTKKILKKAIKYGGSSINDYVSPDGTLGNFQNSFKVYGKEGLRVKGKKIEKVVLYGRSTFFCSEIQK